MTKLYTTEDQKEAAEDWKAIQNTLKNAGISEEVLAILQEKIPSTCLLDIEEQTHLIMDSIISETVLSRLQKLEYLTRVKGEYLGLTPVTSALSRGLSTLKKELASCLLDIAMLTAICEAKSIPAITKEEEAEVESVLRMSSLPPELQELMDARTK